MIDLLNAAKPLTLQLREYHRVYLSLVGCGGTGSHIASGLASLAASLRDRGVEVEMHFYDGDVVEPKNVGRQLFAPSDIGRNKAEALSARINAAFGERVICHPNMLTENDELMKFRSIFQDAEALNIVIGCVDNHKARKVIHDHARQSRLWWLDCGNDEYSGQVCIGNQVSPTTLKGAAGLGLISDLPAPSVIYPDLLENPKKQAERAQAKKDKSCAELVMEGKQGLMINRMVAAHALAMLDAFFRGDLKYFALAFDAVWGGASPLIIDVPTLNKVCKVKVEKK